MAKVTGGEVIVKCLLKEGVKRIFGITDAGYHAVMAAAVASGIRWVGPRHEAAAAHMADGVYKTAGEIPVVMAGYGPGTANLVSGLICSREEGVPVVAISSQARSGIVYPFVSGAFQAVNQYEIMKPVVKWNAVVHQWNRIPEVIQRAFREALSGRPGPVHIDIPYDIIFEEGDDSGLKYLEPHQYRPMALEPPAAQVEEAARLIAEAKNPLLMAGTGVLNSGGWEEFQELVELLNCPATTSMAARSAFNNDHPNYLLGLGEGALTARREADVILAAGTRLGNLDLPYDIYFGDIDAQKLIQVDVDPRNVGTNRPISLGIVADARATLRALLARLKELGVKPASGEAVRRFKDIEAEQMAILEAAPKSYEGDKIHPATSVEAAAKVFGPEAINVGDGGNTSLFDALYLRFTNPRTSLGIFEFGHLGTGIPMAIGAKLANPDKDVYVITGDGAAGFNFMEMETAIREKVKITVIVHAEEHWCMEEIEQLAFFEGDASRVIACQQAPVRWDRVAEGIGCYGEFVDKAEDLLPAFERAKDHELPAVVCVKTDFYANLVPPLADKFMEVYEGPPAGSGHPA
ncbi:MAG: thiamine pyrophosphate-binding protein [Actinobacteria bacterium]|nr:thiamine pyrophosphate-binding protein [Actinomycetota bacterium]